MANNVRLHKRARLLSGLNIQEKRQLRKSITILKVLNQSLTEITNAAEEAYKNCAKDNSPVNWQIMNCVYAYVIIRTSSFFDELTTQFLKIKGVRKSKELVGAIAHFRYLYNYYHVRQFRNFLGHNRKTVNHKKGSKKSGQRRSYRPITDADVAPLTKLNSPQAYSSFSVATARIVKFIDAL